MYKAIKLLVIILSIIQLPIFGAAAKDGLMYQTKSGDSKKRRSKKARRVSMQRQDTQDSVDVQLPSNAYLIDELKVVVFGPEDKLVITLADTQKKALDGKVKTLDDLILDRLMYLDAMQYKILPDEDEIDRYLLAIQRDNNMTLDDLKALFKAAGYTFEEGREQFGMMSVINKLVDFKIRSRLIVPERDVVAYYNANPEIQETAYYLQRALIPYNPQKNRSVQREEVEAFAKEGIGMVKATWAEPFWVNKSDLAESKSFIHTMSPDEISAPQAIADGFEIFKLIQRRDERNRPLEERYREITGILRGPKSEQLFNDYKSNLYDTASILMFN
jgi:hypothetical protein